MIGVLASETEHAAVREFFELFKTPWEFHRSGSQYEVLICTDDRLPNTSAKVTLIYGAERNPFDQQNGIEPRLQRTNPILLYKGSRIPLYGGCLTFESTGAQTLLHEDTQKIVGLEIVSHGRKFIRLGFDLFREIQHLLIGGQPSTHAQIPTLDLHITLVRDLILSSGIALVEIPPVPAGFSFIACLTHDLDHVGMRNHRFDHTMFGFLYRALIGSLIELLRGRKSLRHVAMNWIAAFSLPLVHLGLAKDFWIQFDRYLDIEKDLTSTFFVIPHKTNPGRGKDGPAPSRRATRYDVSEIGDHLQSVLRARCEIGLHGIDAWRDSESGRTELERIRQVTGAREIGVRMHWLFFDEGSPAALEKAGFSYDSTVGYNETVGYRAGTSQAFKPLAVEHMLELPLHIMDTALFYPDHMGLSPSEARSVVADFIENATRLGGALTINWHDRSIAPERLWGDFYVEVLHNLKKRGAWFPTAAQAVSWFRKRRSVVFESVTREGDSFRLKVSLDHSDENLPGLRIRVHDVRSSQGGSEHGEYTEVAFDRSEEMEVAI